MAGSYRHIADPDNKFRGIDLIDNLGDAHEALEECYDIIEFLSGGDKQTIYEAHVAHCKKRYPHYTGKEKWATFDYYWAPETDDNYGQLRVRVKIYHDN